MSTHRRGRESIVRGANYYYHYASPSSSFRRPRVIESRYQGVDQYRDVAFSWYRISVISQGQDRNIHVNNSTPNEAGQTHIRQRNFLMLADWNHDDETMILNGVHNNTDASEAGQISHSRQEIGNYPNFRLENWSQGDETMILNGVDRDRSVSEERNRGLTDEWIMKHLKTRNYDSKDEKSEICVVCQDDLCQENHGIATLECGHEFHTLCIIRWLKQKNVCPLCNAVALAAVDDNQERNFVLRGR